MARGAFCLQASAPSGTCVQEVLGATLRAGSSTEPQNKYRNLSEAIPLGGLECTLNTALYLHTHTHTKVSEAFGALRRGLRAEVRTQALKVTNKSMPKNVDYHLAGF